METKKYKVTWWEADPTSVLTFHQIEEICEGRRQLEALLKKLRLKRGRARKVEVSMIK